MTSSKDYEVLGYITALIIWDDTYDDDKARIRHIRSLMNTLGLK